MTYQQTLDYLFSNLPMFTRIGAAALKPDLTNTLSLCKILGNPELSFKSIHVAGTNGKGSTSHMLASVLQESGLKVGLYTSPHLIDFRERIRVNGEMIPEQYVIDFVRNYQPLFDDIKPSFFEWCVALCFQYFKYENVDVAIVETGLGGRLDSTNVIMPQLSVITNIGWDHTNLLGDTLSKIAFEKAGIIKTKIPVVIGEHDKETRTVFLEKAVSENAPISFTQENYFVKNFKSENQFVTCDIFKNEQLLFQNMELDLGGNYQQKNILTAINAIEHLLQMGYSLSENNIRDGLKNIKNNTRLMGRWQVLGQYPLTVCDTGHNVNGLEYIVEQIRQNTFKKLHMVIGMVNDKDISKMLSLLPKNATYYFCNAAIPRSLNANELKKQGNVFGLLGDSYTSVKEAYEAAKNNASVDDMIYIGGSTFVVAEIL
jgi:dihydrofolate synthase/folylpolyglutamate synthase